MLQQACNGLDKHSDRAVAGASSTPQKPVLLGTAKGAVGPTLPAEVLAAIKESGQA